MVDKNGQQIKRSNILRYIKCAFLDVIVSSVCEGRRGYVDVQHLCSDRHAVISEESLAIEWEILAL